MKRILPGLSASILAVALTGCGALGPNELMFDSCENQCKTIGSVGSDTYNRCTSQPHARACSWYVRSHNLCFTYSDRSDYLRCVYSNMEDFRQKRSTHVTNTINKLNDDLQKAGSRQNRPTVTCVSNYGVTTCY